MAALCHYVHDMVRETSGGKKSGTKTRNVPSEKGEERTKKKISKLAVGF